MARGQAGAADAQRGLSNTAAGQYGANAANLYGTLAPAATKMTQSQGFDPTTLSAITNAGMGGVNANFGSAAGDLKRTAARTGNEAGVAGGLDTLARDKGIAGGQEAGNIQIANADYGAQQRKQGLDMLNSLYGTNVGAENNLYGQGANDLTARAAGGGWSQGFNDVLGGVSGLLKPK